MASHLIVGLEHWQRRGRHGIQDEGGGVLVHLEWFGEGDPHEMMVMC